MADERDKLTLDKVADARVGPPAQTALDQATKASEEATRRPRGGIAPATGATTDTAVPVAPPKLSPIGVAVYAGVTVFVVGTAYLASPWSPLTGGDPQALVRILVGALVATALIGAVIAVLSTTRSER